MLALIFCSMDNSVFKYLCSVFSLSGVLLGDVAVNLDEDVVN